MPTSRRPITHAAAGPTPDIGIIRRSAYWTLCRRRHKVHLTRNAQDLVPRSARSMVASAVRMVIEQPDGMSAREQLDRVIDSLRPRFPAVAELLTSAEAGLLAHFAFPEPHRRQIRSTNPLSVNRPWTEVSARAA